MYRLSGPNIFLFSLVLIIGIIAVSVTPGHFGEYRTLSLFALMLGELGMSFIPVLVLFPKARIVQAIALAIIYLFTTFIISFAAWGINNFGQSEIYAFIWKDGEFYINTHALFVTNLFSFVTLITNFRLVYDEELTKEFREKSKGENRYKTLSGFQGISRFLGLQKPLLKRPQFEGIKTFSSGKTERPGIKKQETSFEEDFEKPFEFEPEPTIALEELPEESSGKLFAQKEEEQTVPTSDFFDEDETSGKSYKETFNQFSSSEPAPSPPSEAPADIKDDLAAIFEQYSSLNAVKKITSEKDLTIDTSSKQYDTKKEQQKKPKKSYELPKVKPEISVHIEGEDIHEASFRQISEAEKLEEIKSELKKELQEEIKDKIEEPVKNLQEPKEEILQSIQSIKEELKKELQDKVQEKSQAETKKLEDIEERIHKTTEAKQEILQSIQDIKEELKKELEDKLKENLIEKTQELFRKEEEKEEKTEAQIDELPDEEIESLKQTLTKINKEPKVTGSMFLSQDGNVIVENWQKQVLHETTDKSLIELLDSINKQINKTNQGSLSNILLESVDGALILSKTENKILTVCTEGTSEYDTCQILRALSELEG